MIKRPVAVAKPTPASKRRKPKKGDKSKTADCDLADIGDHSEGFNDHQSLPFLDPRD